LELSADLDWFATLAESVGRDVGAPFLYARQDDALFIVARAGGQIVHLQAFLRQNGSQSVASHVDGFWRSYHSTQKDGSIPADIFCLAPMAAAAISVAVYHGDLWIKSGFGLKGISSVLSDVLPKYGIFQSSLRFDPDCVYGIVEPRKVMTGLAARWGYSRMQPGIMRWTVPPPDLPMNEWVVMAARADINHLAGEIMEWGLPTLAGWRSHR
jgi:hypothetical protein